MKIATGNYFNIFSETGYDNHGFNKQFDIFILFPEYFELCKDTVESLELVISEKLSFLGSTKPGAEVEDIKTCVLKCLDTLDYEYVKIIVDII